MTWWDRDARTWRWRVVDHAGVSHAGTAGTREAADLAATMAGQRRRADEPDHRFHASWRTHRWSRREGRMIPNTPPKLPRLPVPPED